MLATEEPSKVAAAPAALMSESCRVQFALNEK